VLEEYPNFLAGYQYRSAARKKLGDRKGAEADELVVLKAHLDAQNGVKKQTDDEKEKTRKKSDKNMNNYRKIVVADNEGMADKYKNDYRGRVQDRNVTIVPQPMFVLTYYKKPSDVKEQVYYYNYIDELNSQHTYPEQILITNDEAALTEEQANKHFRSIDEQTSAIVADPDNVHKRFARALDFYLVQDLDNALADLNEAIQCEPQFFLPYFNRAVVRYKQMEYQKVARDYEKKDKKLDSMPAIKNADHELVKRDLDKVIELAPDFVFAHYNRGNILAALKDYRAAIVDYDRALELDPNLAEAYYNRGLTHIFLGNNRQGVQDLSKAGELGLYSAYNIIKRFTERNE
jgi:tetratricopeptide (TPR) repeat protein